MKMRIACISNYFWPVLGGMELHMKRTIEELIKRGHYVEVHTSNVDDKGKKLKNYENHNGITIYRYPFKFYFGYYCSIFIPKITDVDIVHLHGFGMLTNDFAARKYCKTKKCILTTHHGVVIPTDKMLNKIYHTLHRNTIGIGTIRRVHLIGTDQELDKRRIVGMGIQEKKVRVLHEVCVEDQVMTQTYPMPNLPRSFEKYVVFVGRLHKEKSPEHLLLALKKIGRREVGVVFVGPDGGEKRNLEKLAENLGLTERVVFAGNVLEQEKYSFIAHSEFLVLPSFYEGLGAVIIEAWAMSKPVIASRVGGVPYIVSEGVDGLLYEWGDINSLAKNIVLLLGNEELRKKMGRAGRKKVEENYTKTRVVDNIESIYKELLEEKS